ncbi:MAG: hypothetical protein IJN61_03755 [Clostridia bacterium]|nr:hypothetical protein [Clostridia bacterium]
MKILLVSYGTIEYDGRLQELVRVAEHLGEVTLCCCAKEPTDGLCAVGNSALTMKTYCRYLRYVLRRTRGKRYDMIIADNLFAAPPALLLRFLKRPRYLVQDVRELYFAEKMRGKGKVFAVAERVLMKKASVILCANTERAEIMHREFGLKKQPLVFENIRFLSGEYDKTELDKKYEGVFRYPFNLVSTSGLFMERDTDKLIESMKNLDERFGLFFVGNSSDADVRRMNEIMEEYGIERVHLIGKVPMTELLYIVRRCQIGMVHYHKRNLNNHYCASGKIYEFLHEGLPIVTTENPPLKSFCDEHKVGLADDGFSGAVMAIAERYDEYQARVKAFADTVSVDAYNREVAASIADELGGEC